MTQKILVVEDDAPLRRMFAATLVRIAGVEVVFADTIAEARQRVWDEAGFALIALDGCVPGDELNTLPLIREIRELCFRGPLVAMSSDEGNREAMVRAGCTHSCRKRELAALACTLLNGSTGS